MSWGTTSTKYLSVHKDRIYVRLGMSEEPSWWYVVELDRAQQVFRYGGWVPPSYFAKTGSILLIPDILPVFQSHEQESSSASIAFYRSPEQGIVTDQPRVVLVLQQVGSLQDVLSMALPLSVVCVLDRLLVSSWVLLVHCIKH